MAVEYAQSTKSYASGTFTVSTAGFTSPASGDLYLLFMASGDNSTDGAITEDTTSDWTDLGYTEAAGGHVEVFLHARAGSDPGLTFTRSTDLLVETILVRVPAAEWSGDTADVEVAFDDTTSGGSTDAINFPATSALVNSSGIGFTFAAHASGNSTATMSGPTERYDLISDSGFLSVWLGEETGLPGASAYDPGVLTFTNGGNISFVTVGVSGPAGGTQTVTGTTPLDASATLHQPTVFAAGPTQTIEGSLLDSGYTVHTPTVVGPNPAPAVGTPLDASATLHQPTVDTSGATITVSGQVLTVAVVMHEPTVDSRSILGTHLDGSPTFHRPTVSGVTTIRVYIPPTYEMRPPTHLGDSIARGWGSRAPGVERGYLVLSNDGANFTLATTATPDELAAATFYALGGHQTPVTEAEENAIIAAGIGGTFATVPA